MSIQNTAKTSLAFLLYTTFSITAPVFAQGQSVTELPAVTVTANKDAALTVPGTNQAMKAIQQTPGGVAVVTDRQFKTSPANTFKDILGWVPGVVSQNRWGPDGRLSIRGSGLSRAYGNRGINMFMDGVPINTSDGLFDVFEIDPTAYRYVEVYKGANALRYGANSLGGAINFVTPTGRDASKFDTRADIGSFGFMRSQMSTGGVSGPFDYFITASTQKEDGYSEHSNGRIARTNANFGYQFSPQAETRFYVNANTWRANLPGEVTKAQAIHTPKTANPAFVTQDQERNIDSLKIANKTTLRFGSGAVELGLFGATRHVDHPIFQVLDYTVKDYGGFVRATDHRDLGGFKNRLVGGVNVHNGTIDTEQFVNNGGAKGALAASMVDTSENYSIYAENSFYLLPDIALVTGGQFLHATRDRRDRFLGNGDQSGNQTYDIFSPKLGVLWDVDSTSQIFANISRSAEIPTFDSNSFATPASSNIDAQTATTFEIGARGKRPDFTWDVSLYRAQIQDELQCLTTGPFAPCAIINTNQTVHQGIEAGFGMEVVKSLAAFEDSVWFNAAYTLNDFFFDNDKMWGDNQLPGVPKHIIKAEILYKNLAGFYAGPNVEWIPQSFNADNANSLKVDPYALANFKMGYDGGAAWSGYVEGRNLLDKRYISTAAIAGTATPNSEIFNPGAGRAIYAGLRYRF